MARLTGALVEVLWHDAHAATDAWTAPTDVEPGPAVIHSVGYQIDIEQKPGHISLAQSLDDVGNMDGLLCIPLENVRRISALVWRNPTVDPTT
jgi:hypothetical protein